MKCLVKKLFINIICMRLIVVISVVVTFSHKQQYVYYCPHYIIQHFYMFQNLFKQILKKLISLELFFVKAPFIAFCITQMH